MDLLKILMGKKLPQYLGSGMIACIMLTGMAATRQRIMLHQPYCGKEVSLLLISLGTT